MWIEITDRADGQPVLMNFGPGNVRSVKLTIRDRPDHPESTLTLENGNSVKVNNSYNFFKAQLIGNTTPQPQLLVEGPTNTVDVELPEPMKAPIGKIGSGETPSAIVGKLTLKKGGTTSSALE